MGKGGLYATVAYSGNRKTGIYVNGNMLMKSSISVSFINVNDI